MKTITQDQKPNKFDECVKELNETKFSYGEQKVINDAMDMHGGLFRDYRGISSNAVA